MTKKGTRRNQPFSRPGRHARPSASEQAVEKSPWWQFWRNALPQYGITFAQYLVPLMTLPYLTRVLGAETYGQIVLLTAFTGYLQLLVEFGYNLSAATTVSRCSEDTQALAKLRSSVTRGRLLLGAIGALAFVGIIAFSPIADGFTGLAFAYLISAILSALTPIYLFRGLELMPSLSMVLVASRLLFAALIFLLVHSASDAMWIPIANSLGSIVVLSYSLWYFKQKLHLPSLSTDWRTTNRHAKASVPYFVDAVSSTAFGALTVLFISASGLTLEEVAIWAASYQIVAASQSMYSPIIASLLPRMARSHDWRLMRRLLALLGPAILLACAVLFATAELVMRVMYGPEFSGGGIVLQALIPVLLLSFPALLLGAPTLGTMGKQASIASSTMIASVLFIASLGVLWALDGVTLVRVALLRSAAELVLLTVRALAVRANMRSVGENNA